MRSILSVALAALLFGAPVGAASTVTVDQQAVLTDIAAAMSDAPHLQLRAALTPPITIYSVELTEAEKERVAGIEQRAKDAGFSFSLRIEPGDEEHWFTDISCGAFTVNMGIASWLHPEGAAPEGCPHEDGTDHAGTITNLGSVHLGMSQGSEQVLNGIWGYECRYADGSVSGVSEQCTVTMQSWSGGDDVIKSKAYGNPSGIEYEGWATYVGVAIVLGGVTYFAYRRVEKKKT